MSIAYRPKPAASWSSTQAYGFASICLIVGLAGGYLLGGYSGNQLPQPAVAQPTTPTGGGLRNASPRMGQEVTPQQLKHMADEQAQPLLAQLTASPKDPQLLARIGNIYYDAQQFNTAIDYYSKALQITPENPNIRTDMATAYWYLRDVDRALAEFDKSLRYSPTHPGTLLNKGVVLWQGRNDTKGAVASWQKLLDSNPGFPDRQKIVELIARAKEHSGRGGAPRS